MTHAEHTAFVNFAVALQRYNVFDGDQLLSKRAAFNRVYDRHSTSQIDLLVSNHHPTLRLEPRPEYDKVQQVHAAIDAATEKAIKQQAIVIARQYKGEMSFNSTITLMVRGMKWMMENPDVIENSVKEILKRQGLVRLSPPRFKTPA